MSTFDINGYPLGFSNLGKPYALPEGACRDAVNVDFDNNGNIQRRNGRTKVFSGTNVHSVWGDGDITLFVDNGTLYKLNADYTAITLHSGLDANRRLTYLRHAGQIWFTNGVENGRVIDGSYRYWSPEQAYPIFNVAAINAGGMFPGEYQVAITYSHGATGEEGSGDSYPGSITVEAGGGISLTNIPQPTVADTINIYCSTANGTELYLVRQIPKGMTSVDIDNTPSDIEFETQYCLPIPAGERLSGFGSRIYVSSGNVVYCSRPLRYGLYDPNHDFWLYQDAVTVICPASDGMYISTDKAIYFRSGIDTEGENQRLIAAFGSPVMQPVRLPSSEGGQVFAWFSHRGWVIAGPSGQLQPLQDGVSIPGAYAEGHAIFREVDGNKALVGCFAGGSNASPLASSDWKLRRGFS